MLKLFNVVAAVALATLLTGYFRGWFQISRPGSDEYSLHVDRERIDEDTRAARALAAKQMRTHQCFGVSADFGARRWARFIAALSDCATIAPA